MAISVRLHDIPFFRDIPKDVLHNMTNSFTIESFNPGDGIIAFGESVDAIYLIIEGTVDVYTADKEEVIATLSFGSAIGEVSLFIAEKSATAHVVAGKSGATLLVMPKTLIKEKILSDNTFAAYFYRGMCGLLAERLSGTNKVISAKIKELKERLKAILQDNDLLNKIKNTQCGVEELGSTVFKSLATIDQLLKQNGAEPSAQDPIGQARSAVEKILLSDLQSIDRIAQKLGLAIQYLENIERTINNQQVADIRGDMNLFDEQ